MRYSFFSVRRKRLLPATAGDASIIAPRSFCATSLYVVARFEHDRHSFFIGKVDAIRGRDRRGREGVADAADTRPVESPCPSRPTAPASCRCRARDTRVLDAPARTACNRTRAGGSSRTYSLLVASPLKVMSPRAPARIANTGRAASPSWAPVPTISTSPAATGDASGMETRATRQSSLPSRS